MDASHAVQFDQRNAESRIATQLVGRDALLNRIRAFIHSARIDGGALLVTGEPGVGKTALLRAAADAASTDTRVIRAAGVEYEAETSFSGLNQVLFPLLGSIPKLEPVHRDALNVALGFADGAPPSRLVVSNAALVLLRLTATEQPLLVILDDLPWLDRASAGVLSFVARRLAGSQVGLLGASRTGEMDFFDHVGLPEVEVSRLDDAAAEELLDRRFPDLVSAVRERILVEAQGNPLALLEFPVALTPGMRTSGRSLPSALPLSRRLQTLFGSRITMLPPRTRELLLRMALDGTGDVRVLHEGLAAHAGLADLAPAEQARLAYLDDATHRLTFRHPLMRSAVVDLSDAEERQRAHRVLADMWADQPERRAWHLAEATVEPDASVAAELEAAAARILARGDAVGCVKALTRASELSADSDARHRRLAAAAYIGADVAGDLSNASHMLAALRRGDSEGERSLQAAIAAGAYLLHGDGDVATAHRLLVGALEAREGTLDARDPVLAEALYSLLLVCMYGGEASLWPPFEAAMARSDGIPVTVDLGSKTFVDPTHAGATALEDLEVAIAGLANEADLGVIVRIGMAASYVDRLEGCRAALWRVVKDGRRGGAVRSGITAMILIARDDLESGDWDETEQLVEEVLHLCQAHGYRTPTWWGWYLQAAVAAARGDLERAHDLAERLVQSCAPRGVRLGQCWAWQVLGLAALGRGDFDEAYRQASKISPPGYLEPHNPHAVRALLDLVEAAVRGGRGDEAAAHVAAMREANVAALSSHFALVVGGATATAASDESALELFEAALALPDIDRWQFDLARVRLAYGERLRRRRAMSEARVQLNAALTLFERLRARPWVDRASSELRATGQTKPRAGDNIPDRLTPQELEIVSLAASGLTNKQIAERLFLSHRTVGGHLHRAFPKLGVTTRAGLRDALASTAPERLPRT